MFYNGTRILGLTLLLSTMTQNVLSPQTRTTLKYLIGTHCFKL
jgi:hypothetical protein